MEKKRISLALMLVLIITLLFSTIICSAASEVIVQGSKFKTEDVTEFNGAIKDAGGDNCFKATSDGKITFDRTTFSILTQDQRNSVVQNMTGTKLYSELSSKDKESFVDSVSQVDKGSTLINMLFEGTEPNYGRAFGILTPFSGVAGTILAVIVILLSSALAIVIGSDISFLAIPYLQPTGEKNEKPRYVSREAYQAYTEGEQDDKKNKQILLIYLRKRVLMLICLGFCIVYLASGQIMKLVGWIIDLSQGIL